MNWQEFFYISLGVGVWIIVLVNMFVVIRIIWTLDFLKKNIKTYSQIKDDVQIIGDAAKVVVLTIISRLLGKLEKGGEKL
ncbi:hypothetical protein A2394_02905 [Candidatus Woesebacteria bacterium RIFOXYB1_FULL_42_36]|uniref:Uncharacterized protein n=1 Tax=Candidatus Woesebacteria bacterium RIFOXYD1_FULL_43_18 TaxID=1802551 RepID=A0A1F8DI42_9BACT|nr:MAG: hypothetical protein A2394_02905 [Candidatus Woesebacteria bacterium RIFOXYB1_FULL_42_36]OGM88274.1 MAG: hypothetical protein A2573_02560 [Candidatus Woesebacteria bacterium RIFOXYD1_FULL_43_18]